MTIRPYQLADTAAIATLFYETVHHINRRDYSLEQVNAWAPQDLTVDFWVERLSQSISYVAEHTIAKQIAAEQIIAEQTKQIIGFGNLQAHGYLDCFYCHKDFQRMGVGSQLLATLEAIARSQNIQTLTTSASITARSFFEAKGFHVVSPQTVERRGQALLNFIMEKSLLSP